MSIIVVWLFTAYGLTSILVWGSIFENVRSFLKLKSKFLGDLISCTLCTSTWVGFFMSLVLGGLSNKFFDVNIMTRIFFDGMFTAGTVWAINSLIEFFEESRIK